MTTEMLRDVSRAEAARITGHSVAFMKRHWDEIPTAFCEGSRSYVSLIGLQEWQSERVVAAVGSGASGDSSVSELTAAVSTANKRA